MKLPKCYPDEILISRLIRYSTVTGISGSTILKLLLGSTRASIHPFLPAGIRRLSELTGQSQEQILSQQTLAPLFCFFLPKHSNSLVSNMLGSNSAAAYRASQMPSFSSGNCLKLKYCVLCARFDIQNYGVTYWHRTHQVPGLTTCPEHGVKLLTESFKHRQRVISGFLPEVKNIAVASSNTEQQVARFTSNFLNSISTSRLEQDFISIYRLQLLSKGLLTNGGSIKRKELIERFWEFARHYPASEDAPTIKHDKDYRYFSELLIPDSSHHPFRHLLFSTWLFKVAHRFISLGMKGCDVTTAASGKEISKPASPNSKELKCLSFLKMGLSLNSISKTTGVSRCYLKRLAKINSIPIRSIPRKISKSCIAKVIFLARRGTHRFAIAKSCGICAGSVEQIISSVPNLVLLRKKIKFESKRRRCRVAILRYKKIHPHAIRRDFKADCNQPFYWLYLNDKVWLESVLPDPTPPKRRQRSSVHRC